MPYYRSLSVILFVVAMCVATPRLLQSSVTDDHKTAGGDTMLQLKQLQDKVAKLEARLAELEKRKPTGQTLVSPVAPLRHERSPYRGLQQGYGTSRPTEPGYTVWGRGEINGHPYYIVPLGSKH